MGHKISWTMIFRFVLAVLTTTLTLGDPNATIPVDIKARDACERQGSFYCQLSNLCVALRHRCDGYLFCDNGEDEAGCITSSNAPTTPQTLPPYDSCIRQDRFYCGISKSCIPKPWRCDGITDCLYREDEIDCTPNPFISTTTSATPTSPQRYSCLNEGKFYCQYSGDCIEMWQRCDGYSNCPSGEDESGCGTISAPTARPAASSSPPRYSCLNEGKFYCQYSGDCIEMRRRCDGYSNCPSGEDESGCGTISAPTARPGTVSSSPRYSCLNQGNFYCQYSGDCIEMWRRCDGYSNCPSGEDESECGKTVAPTAARHEYSSPSCGSTLLGSAVISSPNYPQRYPNNAACTWYLQSYPSGSDLVVQFQSFDTEANSDIVRVYDESNTSYSFSGSALPPKMVLGKSGKIIFRSDSSTSATGFYLTISSVELKRSSASKLNRGCLVVAASYLASSIMSFCYFGAY